MFPSEVASSLNRADWALLFSAGTGIQEVAHGERLGLHVETKSLVTRGADTKDTMKTLTENEAAGVVGGEPLTFGTALMIAAFGAAAYVAKDIYENWGAFKEAVADGWNNA